MCTLIGEPDWTGQHLKEAIEEKSQWSFLCCSQQLVIGDHLLADSDILGDRIYDCVEVTVLRRPLSSKVFYMIGDRKSLALTLRKLAPSPVVLQLPDHGFLFDLCHVSGKPQFQSDLEHVPLQADELMAWLPWEAMFDIQPDDIAAVIALQSSCMWIGDGSGFVSGVVLLKDGHLIAVTANIMEAIHLVAYQSIICSAVCRASSLDELEGILPAFTKMLSEPPHVRNLGEQDEHEGLNPSQFPRVGPLRVFIGDCPQWGGEQLDQWRQRTGHADRFRGGRVGVRLPLEGFCQALAIPQELGTQLEHASELSSLWASVCRETEEEVSEERSLAIAALVQQAKGKGKGKFQLWDQIEGDNAFNLPPCDRTFADAVLRVREELASRLPETDAQAFDDTIERLLALAPGDTRSYNFSALGSKALSRTFVQDLVLGRGISTIVYP